tara:strand:+ start:1094 stop:1381 length:288 start_codon:yes stop_codon:yes gene_type:complete
MRTLKKKQEIQILKDNVKQLQEALSKTHIRIQEKIDIITTLESKMRELEANILEYQKIIPDVMDSKTRITVTQGSVKTQKLNDYGIPIPPSEDFS